MSSLIENANDGTHQAIKEDETEGRLMALGKFRIRGEPDLVQVQFGPFSRPIPENEYRAKGYEPAAESLNWLANAGTEPRDSFHPQTGDHRRQ